MKKKILILIVLSAFFESSKSQSFYSKTTDSLLALINQIIREDLLKEEIYVERSWKWIEFGDCFIFEIVFDSKNSGILSMFQASESMKKKYEKQEKFSVLKLRLDAFREYVTVHNTLPYSTFEYFNYRFLLPAKKGESFGDVLYGEYKFKVTDNGVSIMDKKIEILQGEDAIMEKYKSNF